MSALPSETRAELDPGIRRTVAWFREHGFDTTDSGDGRTKVGKMACAIETPHVFCRVPISRMVSEADRLFALMHDSGRVLDPGDLDVTYLPGQGSAARREAMLSLWHWDDARMFGRRRCVYGTKKAVEHLWNTETRALNTVPRPADLKTVPVERCSAHRPKEG